MNFLSRSRDKLHGPAFVDVIQRVKDFGAGNSGYASVFASHNVASVLEASRKVRGPPKVSERIAETMNRELTEQLLDTQNMVLDRRGVTGWKYVTDK